MSSPAPPPPPSVPAAPGASSPRRAWLPLLLAALIVAGCAAYFARDLGAGEVQHWDAYFTLDRSLGFLKTGDWLTITSNHAPVNQKPPLQYWLTAPLLAAGWDAELAIRFWPFLFAVGSLVLTGLLAALLAPGRPWAVPAAVALLACSVLFWTLGRMGMLDTGQTFFLVATLCAVLLARRSPRWWIAAGILAGLGALQKSPVALAFAAVMVAGLARFERGGPYAWARLKPERRFRVGAWTALALTLAWPLLQAARHGIEFLGPYFGKQMIRRFQPANPFSEDTAFSPFRWVPWLFNDAPVAAGLCVLLVIVALAVPRLRAQPVLRTFASLVALSFVVLTVAGGQMYDRYLLVLWPLLAAVAGVVLASVLPRPSVALLVAGLALATASPSLAQVPEAVYARDRTMIRTVCERFLAHLRPEETPVFVSPSGQLDFPPGAFLVYTNLDRPILFLSSRRWDLLDAKVAERSFGPPYFGVIYERQLADAERHFGPLVRVDSVGPYVLWRQASPGPR